ncbi:short transient receptor potential channel 4-like isoform X3 [Stylophora pistillata]|uniref:short transient receptor potential channel 4-like isoform X3 n=1 Tax=Stylophora pistillata TaxID=50429 RepID=UPI000C0545D2|nr:short transient receptor potential channel 4-like isoform X3 [Stylophora pistillata]
MAEQGNERNGQHQTESGSNVCTDFLDAVSRGTKEDVEQFIQPASSDERRDSRDEDPTRVSYKQQLMKALENEDAVTVWKLIARAKESDLKTLEKLNKTCETVAEHERLKEKGLIKYFWEKLRGQIRSASERDTHACIFRESRPAQTELQHEEEQEWIRILSDPLYIGLEWLWRNNLQLTGTAIQQPERRESKLGDIVQAALDDAYLLEKIARYEHHYSRDEYYKRALECEKFAADVVEGSNFRQLREVMDIDGNGCLMEKKPKNFNQSLSLLKFAADKNRKMFVANPKCQWVLNEIIYYKWPDWRNKSRWTKVVWFFFQLLLVAVSSVFYIPIRLVRKFYRCCQDDGIWEFRELYEHPYSKFINHTMWYLVFLWMIFLTSFDSKFGTTVTGLIWCDYVVLSFVLGLLLQECREAWRQGIYIYMSKWWNVVDTLIIFTFLASSTVWLLSYWYFGKWKPREAFVLADVLYASASVMAYFHLTHIFQVDSVLGPLQLSLYKMLKDVQRFLFIFLVLYFSFANGVVKVYSYYVISQFELRKNWNHTEYEESHSYADHKTAFIALFWLLLGLVEEDKIDVKDPAFTLTATFGRLFLMAYVVCTVIVALNMLIAMMNNSFERIMKNSDIEWKYSRSRMWLEWIDKGNTMPAPINIVYYTFYLIALSIDKVVGKFKEKCRCCHGNGEPDEEQAQREEPDEEQAQRERRDYGQERGTCNLEEVKL